jgi:SHS2 domain-containing protein
MPETKTFLSHTADVRLRVTSETLPGLFKLGLDSLNQILAPEFEPTFHTPELVESIHIVSPDTDSLLVDFLSEVLTLSSVNKAIYYDLFFVRLTDSSLTADLSGSSVDHFETDIKAVTYHEASIELNELGEWETTLVFDI